MKEILQKKIQGVARPENKYHALREGLQHLILKILDDGGFFQHMSFMGGTALRVLFEIQRFSEDMDFSLQKPRDPKFEFKKMVAVLAQQLEIYGLPAETKMKLEGPVLNVFLRFENILQELGVSRRQGEKLAIKLEVDTNPPAHARYEVRLVQKDFMFSVVHHDLSTLCAGKLLAFLNRSYTKGRDVYDLIWFCGQKSPANRQFFESGMQQVTGQSGPWTEEALAKALIEKVEATDLSVAVKDVLPFLEDPKETRFFERAILLSLVRQIDYT